MTTRFYVLRSVLCYCSRFIALPILIYSAVASTGLAQTQYQLPEKENNYQPRPYNGHMEADDGQWVRPAKDYAGTRYSTLKGQLIKLGMYTVAVAFGGIVMLSDTGWPCEGMASVSMPPMFPWPLPP